jgi:hypothetical protein
MRSIRKFAYAAVLALSVFTVQPTLAAAEDARGVFTLTHEVHWQNCILGPGEYSFSIRNSAPPTILTLRGVNGSSTDAMFLVTDVESTKSEANSQLVLVSRDGKSFVSSMNLPEFDMVLRFAVPPEKALK